SRVREVREGVVLVERGDTDQVRLGEVAGVMGSTSIIVFGPVTGGHDHDDVVGLRGRDGVAEGWVERPVDAEAHADHPGAMSDREIDALNDGRVVAGSGRSQYAHRPDA